MVPIPHLLAKLKDDPIVNAPVAQYVEQLCLERNIRWRDRLFTPLVTIRMFLIQIFHGNCSICALRQLSGQDFAPSSYSDARKRLPLILLQDLLQWLCEQAASKVHEAIAIGNRILICDGSNHSMPDTLELREYFDLPPGTREGVGYPAGKLMGLLDAATGMFVSLLGLPLFQHDMRSVISLHPMLRMGDILLGDRAFCTFAHLALLNARGVLACMRLHQRRKNQKNGINVWKRPKEIAAWMSAAQHALLPEFLSVRIVRYTIAQKGYRTREVWIATTLTDTRLWPDEKIAELYGHRWNIETCFNHLKTTMKMNVLRCETVEGVKKELAVYLAVYNLIRLAMLNAAQEQGVSVWRISFIDAMRWLAARMLGLPGVRRLIVNPDRRGRSQLRVIRRRMKEYDLLTVPRREMEAKLAEKQGKNA
jgi:hypothetical protein